MEKNPYEILGLNIEAPMTVIKAAYKALMKSDGHPDLGGSSDFAQKLNEAYQILSNEEKKKKLDNNLKSKKTAQKTIYYILCISCGALNSLQSPHLIKQSKCYQCSQAFRVDSSSENKHTKEKKTTKKEQVNEKMAYEFFHRKMYHRSIREYNFLISENPTESYYYYYMIGLCCSQQSQFRESLKNFLKSLERKSNYWEAGIEAGKALVKMHQYSEALIHFTRCLPQVKNPHKIRTHIGICYYKMGMFSKAVQELLLVIDIDPIFEQAIYFLALSFYQMHDFSRAKKYFLMSEFHYNDNQKIKEMIDYCNTRLIYKKR